MGKQKSAAAAGAVATGPVPRPPVLEHTTAELVSLIASPSEREDFTVDILGQAFALAQQRVGIYRKSASIPSRGEGSPIPWPGELGRGVWVPRVSGKRGARELERASSQSDSARNCDTYPVPCRFPVDRQPHSHTCWFWPWGAASAPRSASVQARYAPSGRLGPL